MGLPLFRNAAATIAVASACLAGCGRPPPPPPVAPAGPATPDVEQSVKRSIVRIRNLGCGVGVGSGWVIDSTHFVTNSHVIEGDGRVELNLWNGTLLRGVVERASPRRDIAIVRVPFGLPPPLPLFEGEPEPGMRLMVAGFPLGERFAIARARVIGEDEFLGLRSYALDAPLQHGNSGGPALDETGSVVGVVNSKNIRSHRAFAIPVRDVVDLKSGVSEGQPNVPCGTADALLYAAS